MMASRLSWTIEREDARDRSIASCAGEAGARDDGRARSASNAGDAARDDRAVAPCGFVLDFVASFAIADAE
jgi:hypothetical protein